MFSQCGHYSSSVRSDALSGLKELLNQNSALTHQHLSVLIENTAQLMVDKEASVRLSVQRVLKLIFSHVTGDQISPFFPILSAYLSSAMTHINDDIQRDSLKFLDLLLEYFPGLVTSECGHLLQMFIDQISQKGHKKSRSLLVNPNSNISSMKRGQNILKRLYAFLHALIVNDGDKGTDMINDNVIKIPEDRETYHQPFNTLQIDPSLFQFR